MLFNAAEGLPWLWFWKGRNWFGRSLEFAKVILQDRLSSLIRTSNIRYLLSL